MSSLAILYRRVKKLIFFLIIFYLVRSYYLRKKRGDSGNKRISGPPERKRITDGSEQKLKEDALKDKEEEKEKKENDKKEKIEEEKAVINLDSTETAVYTDIHDEFKKDENHVIEAIENDTSYSVTENIKDPKFNKEVNSIDIEKTEIINDIIKENELEERTHQVPIVNNIEIIPTSVIDDIQIQIPNQQPVKVNEEKEEENEKEKEKELEINKISKSEIETPVSAKIELINEIVESIQEDNNEEVPITISSSLINAIETKVIDDIANQLDEKKDDDLIEPKEQHSDEELVAKVEEVIEKPEELVEVVEDIIIPTDNQDKIIENPEKVNVVVKDLTKTIEESESSVIVEDISEEIIEPPVEEALKEIVENNDTSVAEKIIEDITEPETIEKVQNIDNSEKTEEIIEDIIKPEILPSDNIEIKQEEIVENIEKEKPKEEKEKEKEVIVVENIPENIKVDEKIVDVPVSITEDSTEPQVIEDVTEEVIELSGLEDEKPLIDLEETPRDLPITSTEKENQYIDSLINEIDKVVNDSESDHSFIKEEKKPNKNSADIVGHEEIIYEDGADGDDEGEWVDEDDDEGEWVDEDDDDGEWVDEDDDGEWVDEEENKKPEKPSLLINTSLNNKLSSRSLNSYLNTPSKRQSLHLNTPMDLLMTSLKTPLSTSTTAFPLSVYNQDEKKPKVLPDAILDRIFRETDPQTMWVLRNTSLKTRAIVDNILRETFEQFDLSMDPLYFDVTSKENLGLVLNSLDLSPFALSMLLHEILKLDSQHIGYAFGQMFRVPSKIDIDYLTELIVDTLCILKEKRDVDIAAVMNGLQSYYCFNHSELEFYQLFEMIEMSPQEVARFIQNHHHFILSKSLPPLLSALDVDEVFVAEMCKTYANDDMDSFARIISKVPVHLVRTSIHPSDVQGDRVVVVNENGENVIVVLNDEDKNGQGKSSSKGKINGDWEEEGGEENEENEEENMIVVENNESFSIFVGRVLRFLNMTTKDVASFLKYLPEYCTYDEDEILEGLNWNEQQIAEMRQIMKEEQDKIAKKMKELSKLIIQRRLSISSGVGSPIGGSPVSSPIGRSASFSTPSNSNVHHYY